MINRQESMPKKVTIEYENGSTRSYDKGMVMGVEDKGITTEFIECSHEDFTNIAMNFLMVIDEMRNKMLEEMQ